MYNMCIVYMYYIRYKQCLGIYVYYYYNIYGRVVGTKRATLYIYIYTTLCMARRLATTRATNKYLIFQTTSQPELLAAVFDPIIKSFSSYNPNPVPSIHGQTILLSVRT